jgi:FAD/FMN-containing dehydrogenase
MTGASETPVRTTSGSETTLSRTDLESLRSVLLGSILRAGDQGYEDSRRIFNAMIDRRPALIVRCASAGDVVHAVRFGREHELLVAVRGGGHGVAGKAVCDGGMLIDLSLMKGIRVDPVRQTVRAGPGIRLAELDRETQVFGFATPTGLISNTGIAGLTLGGGLGWLNGKYGLACDNLLAVDVVTPDGQLLTASAAEHSDLFWGVRGGSGNFGVVTSFEYRLHQVGPVLAGMIAYPYEDGRAFLRAALDFAYDCPDELTTKPVLLTLPDGAPAAAVNLCYCGPVEQGERIICPLRSFGTPIFDSAQPRSYVGLQSMLDAGVPLGNRHYWKSSFVRRPSDGAVEAMVDFMARKASPMTFAYLQHAHGATARVKPSETAFSHRVESFDFAIISQWPDAAADERNVSWTREFFDAMRPHVESGVYVNNLGDEGEERIRAAYGPNYDRLARLKRKYDPTNFFRLNQNIRPAS